MSIGDGFALWIGKALADLAFIGVILGVAVVAAIVHAALDRRRGR